MSPATTTAPEVSTPLRLFESDLEFAKEAFQELLDSQPPGLSQEARLKEPQWEDHILGFTLDAPLDLRQRYRFLPPELHRSKHWTFKLSCDRELIQKALERSRQDADAWPEYELFWEQHPVAEWLNDRMAAHFRRHEAPLLQVQRGLEPGETAFVFQGVLSNKRSQPMIAEWFAVRIKSQGSAREQPLADLVRETGLAEKLVNPGKPIDVGPLRELRTQAVALAREHMQRARNERSARLTPELKASQRKLNEWAKRKHAEIEARRRAASAEGKKLRSDLQQRFDLQQAEVDKQLQARKTWLTDTLSTVNVPYLRIAAVLSRPKEQS